MKRDLLIYAIVASLTLALPCVAYFVFAGQIQAQREESLKLAARYESLAKSIEEGKAPIQIENMPTFMRMHAGAEKKLSETYAHFSSAADHFLLATFGIAVLQFALLMVIFIRRKNITFNSTVTPNGARQ